MGRRAMTPTPRDSGGCPSSSPGCSSRYREPAPESLGTEIASRAVRCAQHTTVSAISATKATMATKATKAAKATKATKATPATKAISATKAAKHPLARLRGIPGPRRHPVVHRRLQLRLTQRACRKLFQALLRPHALQQDRHVAPPQIRRHLAGVLAHRARHQTQQRH